MALNIGTGSNSLAASVAIGSQQKSGAVLSFAWFIATLSKFTVSYDSYPVNVFPRYSSGQFDI